MPLYYAVPANPVLRDAPVLLIGNAALRDAQLRVLLLDHFVDQVTFRSLASAPEVLFPNPAA